MKKQLDLVVFLKKALLFLLIVITFIFTAHSGYPDTTYIIQKGDNPTTIARKFHIKSNDILTINNLNPRRLIPGTEIIIPSIEKNLDTDTFTRDPDTTCKGDIECEEDVPDNTITYRVKKG